MRRPALVSNVSYFEQRVCRWGLRGMALEG